MTFGHSGNTFLINKQKFRAFKSETLKERRASEAEVRVEGE